MRAAPEPATAEVAAAAPRPVRGALTFVVLLLLVGSAQSGAALRWMATAATPVAVAPAAEHRARVESRPRAPAPVAQGIRRVSSRTVVVRTVTDALLPPPRAPDVAPLP